MPGYTEGSNRNPSQIAHVASKVNSPRCKINTKAYLATITTTRTENDSRRIIWLYETERLRCSFS